MNKPRFFTVLTAVAVLGVTGCAEQKPAISEDAPLRDQASAAESEQPQQDTLNTTPADTGEDFQSLFEPDQNASAD